MCAPLIATFAATVAAAAILLAAAPAAAQRGEPQRFRQASSGAAQLGPPGRPPREISDQEHAKNKRDRGQNKEFDELFSRARSVGRGEYLGVEPDISSNIYRFKFMRPGGKVVWVDMDGRTGRVIAEQD